MRLLQEIPEVSILKKLRIARYGYILMSVVFYAAGIFCIVLPEVSPAAACFSCGIALTAYGVIKLIGYFRTICSVWHFSTIWASAFP